MTTLSETNKHGFRTGDKHGWLRKACELFEKMDHGRAADEVLDDLSAMLPSEYRRSKIILFPMWKWVTTTTDIAGRKGRSSTGGRLQLPMRIRWSEESVMLAACDTSYETTWSGSGYGRTARGSVVITKPGFVNAPTVTAPTATSGVPPMLPTPTISRTIPSRARAIKELTEISQAGEAAKWALFQLMEPWLEHSLALAHHRVTKEFHPEGRAIVLSATTMEQITTNMLYGTSTAPGTLERMFDAVLRQDFSKVDPMRYIKVFLSRDSEEAIRRDLDDPKQGGKIRRVAKTLDTEDEALILAEYQSLYPADEIGKGRVQRAMSVGTDPMAERLTLEDFNRRTESGGFSTKNSQAPVA